MAVGQGALTATLDVGALDAVELRLEVQGVAVCQAHAVLLRDVLELDRVLSAAGAALSTVPQVALLLQVSEQAAHTLLAEAQLLASLPGGQEALECGLLTVAQSAAFWRAVRDLAPQVQQDVWAQLQARLGSAEQDGVVLPPARLAQLLARWVVQADPDDAQERRRRAEAQGDVSYRRREDGLADLFATAIPAPLMQAVLCRIRAAAQPTGAEDDRTAGKRRLDALVDLLLGRQPLPFDDRGEPAPCSVPACGCRPDERRSRAGGAGRRRRRAREHRRAGRRTFDHRPTTPPDVAPDLAPPDRVVTGRTPLLSRPRPRPGGHPPGTSGPYRLPRRLRRLVQVRAPRCEWPGCGVRSQACDVDHDRAHPHGATCACNTGPLCRRHHRVKQLLVAKARVEGSAVVWTSPTGRRWTSPSQHLAPQQPRSTAPRRQDPEPRRGPTAPAELPHRDAQPDRHRDLGRDDGDGPGDTDTLGERIRDDDGWDLALDDPSRWAD